MARTIELIEATEGNWTVIGDGRFATQLTHDEALWTVVMLMVSDRNRQRYLRTYEQEMAWRQRYPLSNDVPVPPVALLEDLSVRGPAALKAEGMGQVVRVRDELGQILNTFIRLKGSQ